MSRAEAVEIQTTAEMMEVVRRKARRSVTEADVRALAASSTPRIRPDRSAVVKELQGLRSFHAHRDMKAIAVDVELIDALVELLGG